MVLVEHYLCYVSFFLWGFTPRRLGFGPLYLFIYLFIYSFILFYFISSLFFISLLFFFFFLRVLPQENLRFGPLFFFFFFSYH